LCEAWRICYCGLRKVTKGFPGHKGSDGASPFLEGQEQVEDEPRVGRPSTSETDDNVGRVRSLVRSDHQFTLRMISSELSLNRFTVYRILTWDFGMRKCPMSPCGSSVLLFTGSQSLWLIFIPLAQNHLKGCHFGTSDNIQKSITDELKGIPAEAFPHCYERWKQCLRRCIAA
jgi:hypothetical protein